MFEALRCPRDRLPLTAEGRRLGCAQGHSYPVVDGVPVLLVAEAPQTIALAHASSSATDSDDGYYVETLGITPHERRAVLADLAAGTGAVDPAVSWLVGATCGRSYAHAVGRLRSYPIPELPLPDGSGQRLLDIGCSWGRWSVAAAYKGYRVVGLDPSLGALLAAKRVARKLGTEIEFVCGDARFLPFEAGSFNAAFSYSVLQHFAEDNAYAALAEIGRVLRPGGVAKIQMANRIGLRSLYHRARRGFREPRDFEVRYWRLRDLQAASEAAIGPTRIAAEAFGGLGLLWSDRSIAPPRMLALMAASEGLRRASQALPALRLVADSVYIEAMRCAGTTPCRPSGQEGASDRSVVAPQVQQQPRSFSHHAISLLPRAARCQG